MAHPGSIETVEANQGPDSSLEGSNAMSSSPRESGDRAEGHLTGAQPARRGSRLASRMSVWLRAAALWANRIAGSRRARTWFVGVLILITLSILAWSVYREWDTLVAFDWHFSPAYLGLSFLCYSVGLSLWLTNWHGIMGRLAGFDNYRLNIKIYLYSAAARRLPGFVWYVGGLLYLYQQEGVPKTITSVGVVLESALMTLSGLLVFLGLMPLSEIDLLPAGSPWFLLGATPLLAVALQPSLLVRILNIVLPRLGRPALELQIRRRDSIRWVAQYAAGSICAGLALYFLAWAIYPLPLAALPGIVGIVALTPALRLVAFFVPGGWGLQELGLSLSLNPYLPLPIALGVPLLFRLWLIAGELAWIAAASLLL